LNKKINDLENSLEKEKRISQKEEEAF